MVRLKKEMKGGSKVKQKSETEEEKMVRAEMLALQMEEERRRREEAARLRLRRRQIAEERYTRINAIKIHNQWRKIMRLAKVEDLRREIEVLSQNHEREVDRKDAIIQMLDRDLEDAEEQYQMALRSHLQVADALCDLQYARCKSLAEEFASALGNLEEEFDTERSEIINAHARQRKDFHDTAAAMEAEFADAESDARQEFEAQREEIKNRNSEEYNVLKISLEGTIEELERHFEQAHQAYLASTDARTQSFRQLTRSDAQSARIIERRMRKLVRLQDSLAHWRTKITTNSREWEERNKALRNEKNVMNAHYQQLKAQMNRRRSTEGNRLQRLAVCSGAAIKELDKKLSVADRILRRAELCRKLETEPEKVIPFHASAAAALDATARAEAAAATKRAAEEAREEAAAAAAEEAEIEAAKVGKSALPEPTMLAGAPGGAASKMCAEAIGEDGQPVEEWDMLDGFYRRYNKALLDKLGCDKEKGRLRGENDDLRAILKQYLDGISVNEDVIGNPANPLLVVNGRLQLSQGGGTMGGPANEVMVNAGQGHR